MKFKEIKIAQIIEEYNMPKGSHFLGFVVHLPYQDEFLVSLTEDNMGTSRMFSKLPELAKTYSNYKKALKESKKCNQTTVVAMLFDMENQLGVFCIDYTNNKL